MLPASAHQKFLLLVQTAALVKDYQTGKRLGARAVAQVFDIDDVVFNDYEDDGIRLADMANQYVDWLYGDAQRPNWISFWNGPNT